MQEETAVQLIEAKEELEKLIDGMIKTEREIRNIIYSVSDVDCRLILEYRYLNMNSWNDIAAKLECTQRHVFRIHGMALKMVDTALEAWRMAGDEE